tara:strand:- start:7910 stop:9139 length:1230 start_codon:yes stop_codon:yes gene_type:complete
LINPNKLKAGLVWWNLFPIELRIITKIRFFASVGAGGVIYLTSLIFNNIGLSATEIGLGFAISAIVGTLTRIITGNYLNDKNNIQLPLRISSICSIIASCLLICSRDSISYVFGQSFIGAAAGIYWPSAEISVPYLCKQIKLRKAYALVRSAEALGIFLGVFLGSFLNTFFYFKSIFINDILCMIIILIILFKNNNRIKVALDFYKSNSIKTNNSYQNNWHQNTISIIGAILLITTCLALIQVTLPLDFVKGGIYRNSISKNLASYIISFQLVLLFLLQWPIGSWLVSKGRLFGLKFSLLNFFFTTITLFFSSYLKAKGIYLMIISIIFCSLGISSFLPTSTDVILKIAPIRKRGFALALLSQCFALGYFIGPLISGRIIDYYGYASIIWALIALVSISIYLRILKMEL